MYSQNLNFSNGFAIYGIIAYFILIPDAPKVAMRMSNSVIGSRSLTINEGQRINLTCVVDANPKISGDIEWTYNYGPVISYGPSYMIDSVNRINAGNYSCRARNTLTPSGRPSLQQTGSTTLEILVQCKYLNVRVKLYCYE